MRRASGSGWFEETVKAGLIATEWLKTGGRGHKALLVTAETDLPWITKQGSEVLILRLWQTFRGVGGYGDSI